MCPWDTDECPPPLFCIEYNIGTQLLNCKNDATQNLEIQRKEMQILGPNSSQMDTQTDNGRTKCPLRQSKVGA